MPLFALRHTAWTFPTKCLRRFLSTIPSLPPELQPIIGLEIHAQLNTKRKLFSTPNDNQAAPNTAVGYHDIGLPGSLPVLNKEAVLLAVKASLALGCTINPQSSFDRKHYFYKDLPSGYQITQQYNPLAKDGLLGVHKRDDTTRQLAEDFVLPITRVQLEQDTAKTTTIQQLFNYTVFEEPLNSEKEILGRIQEARQVQEKILLDHNRSSIPLIEIITPPVLTSPYQAATALTKVAEILRATGVATADFHLGAMRCDVNVSLGLNSARTEIKNLFSSSAVRDACTFEIASLVELCHSQQEIVSQTKTWDGSKTVALRDKEGEKDYRYLPDADLPPILLDPEFVQKARASLPPLPDYLITILMNPPHNLTFHMAKRLSTTPNDLEYYTTVMERGMAVDGQKVCNWLIYQIQPLLDYEGRKNFSLETSPFPVDYLLDLLNLLDEGVINSDGAKLILQTYFPPNEPPNIPPSQHPLLSTFADNVQENDQIRELVIEIIATTPLQKKVREMESLERGYMGKLMRQMRGKLDANLAREIIQEEMTRRLEFIRPESGSTKYWTVRRRSPEEVSKKE